MKIKRIETVDDCSAIVATDMRAEAEKAIGSGSILYATDGPYADDDASRVTTNYLYVDAWGRGAVNVGADSEWTDCTSLGDLTDRWEHYDERWSN